MSEIFKPKIAKLRNESRTAYLCRIAKEAKEAGSFKSRIHHSKQVESTEFASKKVALQSSSLELRKTQIPESCSIERPSVTTSCSLEETSLSISTNVDLKILHTTEKDIKPSEREHKLKKCAEKDTEKDTNFSEDTNIRRFPESESEETSPTVAILPIEKPNESSESQNGCAGKSRDKTTNTNKHINIEPFSLQQQNSVSHEPRVFITVKCSETANKKIFPGTSNSSADQAINSQSESLPVIANSSRILISAKQPDEDVSLPIKNSNEFSKSQHACGGKDRNNTNIEPLSLQQHNSVADENQESRDVITVECYVTANKKVAPGTSNFSSDEAKSPESESSPVIGESSQILISTKQPNESFSLTIENPNESSKSQQDCGGKDRDNTNIEPLSLQQPNSLANESRDGITVECYVTANKKVAPGTSNFSSDEAKSSESESSPVIVESSQILISTKHPNESFSLPNESSKSQHACGGNDRDNTTLEPLSLQQRNSVANENQESRDVITVECSETANKKVFPGTSNSSADQAKNSQSDSLPVIANSSRILISAKQPDEDVSLPIKNSNEFSKSQHACGGKDRNNTNIEPFSLQQPNSVANENQESRDVITVECSETANKKVAPGTSNFSSDEAKNPESESSPVIGESSQILISTKHPNESFSLPNESSKSQHACGGNDRDNTTIPPLSLQQRNSVANENQESSDVITVECSETANKKVFPGTYNSSADQAKNSQSESLPVIANSSRILISAKQPDEDVSLPIKNSNEFSKSQHACGGKDRNNTNIEPFSLQQPNSVANENQESRDVSTVECSETANKKVAPGTSNFSSDEAKNPESESSPVIGESSQILISTKHPNESFSLPNESSKSQHACGGNDRDNTTLEPLSLQQRNSVANENQESRDVITVECSVAVNKKVAPGTSNFSSDQAKNLESESSPVVGESSQFLISLKQPNESFSLSIENLNKSSRSQHACGEKDSDNTNVEPLSLQQRKSVANENQESREVITVECSETAKKKFAPGTSNDCAKAGGYTDHLKKVASKTLSSFEHESPDSKSSPVIEESSAVLISVEQPHETTSCRSKLVSIDHRPSDCMNSSLEEHSTNKQTKEPCQSQHELSECTGKDGYRNYQKIVSPGTSSSSPHEPTIIYQSDAENRSEADIESDGSENCNSSEPENKRHRLTKKVAHRTSSMHEISKYGRFENSSGAFIIQPIPTSSSNKMKYSEPVFEGNVHKSSKQKIPPVTGRQRRLYIEKLPEEPYSIETGNLSTDVDESDEESVDERKIPKPTENVKPEILNCIFETTNCSSKTDTSDEESESNSDSTYESSYGEYSNSEKSDVEIDESATSSKVLIGIKNKNQPQPDVSNIFGLPSKRKKTEVICNDEDIIDVSNNAVNDNLDINYSLIQDNEDEGSSEDVETVPKHRSDVENFSSPSSDSDLPLKKPRINEYDWERNKAKRKSLAGEKKVLKDVGICCRRFKCYKAFNVQKRELVRKNYYSLKSVSEKWLFLAGHLAKLRTKTTAVNAKRPRASVIRYYFPDSDGDRIQVCRTMFLGTFILSDKTVRNIISKMDEGNFEDGRGKAKPVNTRLTEIRSIVKEHIQTFHVMPSHYVRRTDSKKYLPPGLNVTKMYDLYRSWFIEQPDKIVYNTDRKASKAQYRAVVSTFNIGFYKCKKDECSFCVDYMRGLKTEAEFQEHSRLKNIPRDKKKADKLESKRNPLVCTATYDMQKILTCPISNNALTFYRGGYHVHNLTIYDLAGREGFNYPWEERDGQKGSKEIIGCLMKFVDLKINIGVNEFRFYTDNCWGQNKNKFVIMFYVWLSFSYKVNIKHQYFLKGHTQNEGDSVHARIENASKNSEIFSPTDWIHVIRNAKKTGKKYKVEVMQWMDFKSTKQLVNAADFSKLTFISKVTYIEIDRKTPCKIKFELENGTNVTIDISTKKLLKAMSETVKLPRAYQGKQKLETSKEANLKFLLKKNVIPHPHKAFYKQFITISDSE